MQGERCFFKCNKFMAIIIGLEPGVNSFEKPRYLLREGSGGELKLYSTSEKVQRYIREAGLKPGDIFDEQAFKSYLKDGEISLMPAGATRLNFARRTQAILRELTSGLKVTKKSRIGRVGSVEAVLSGEDKWARFRMSVVFDGVSAEEQTEVWIYQGEASSGGKERGIKLPRSGQRLRFYLACPEDGDAAELAWPPEGLSWPDQRLICLAPYLYPVRGDFLWDRKKRRWQIRAFNKDHNNDPSLRTIKYPGKVCLGEFVTERGRWFHCEQIVWRAEKLVYFGSCDDGVAKWKVVSLGCTDRNEVDEAWQAAAKFWAGEVSAEEVDWRGLGLKIRETLESGQYLPRPIWEHWSRTKTGEGKRLSHVWSALRRDHINTCWAHLRSRVTLGQLAGGNARDWDIERMHQQFVQIFRELYFKHRFALDWAWSYAQRLEKTPAEFLNAQRIRLEELIALSETTHRGYVSRSSFFAGICGDLGIEIDEEYPVDEQMSWLRLHKSLPPPREQYRRFALTKSNGSPRWIDEPCPELRRIQLRIASILGGYRAAHPCAMGFVPGRSAVMHARMHEGARAAICVDIKDFFPSITQKQVYKALADGPTLGEYRSGLNHPFKNWHHWSLHSLSLLVTHPYDKCLPQGAPSSPAVANLVAYELDAYIMAALDQLKGRASLRYSRYADDMVISSRKPLKQAEIEQLLNIVKVGVESMGWAVAEEKTKAWQASARRPLEICGLIVPRHEGGELRLPRSVRRRLRAAIHHVNHDAAMPEDIGLIAYAYAVTGKHRLRAMVSGPTRAYIDQLAGRLVPADYRHDFIDGWMAK